MPPPKPELGLVVHYGFVWTGAGRRPPLDAGKGRPCVIVDLEDVVEPDAGGRTARRVTYLPISHTPPRDGERALAVPPRVARHLGLTGASFLYTSYAVEDDWPFDVEPVPGAEGRAAYGLIPPRLFAAVALDFADHLALHPGAVHRREG